MFSAKRQLSSAKSNDITEINYLEFIYFYLKYGNFYDTVKSLEKRYDAINFKVSLTCVTMFYIIQNKHDIKKILTANTKTGYQNHNFDVSHDHSFNINATQAFLDEKSMEKNPLWKHIHAGLAHSTGDRELIEKLMNKHIYKFFIKTQFDLDIAFEDFMLGFWCEYLFGPKVSADEFKKTRQKLLSALKYTFYDNRLKVVPYIGTQLCKFYHYLKKDDFSQVNAELSRFINQADSGLIVNFKKYLKSIADFPQDKVDKAVLDNLFDFVLVFDFIHNALYETLVSIVKSNIDEIEERKKAYLQGLHNAFLFSFRVRIPQQDIELESTRIKKGVPIYINLLKSELYHSYGPRSCVGIAVTNWVKEAMWHHLKYKQLRVMTISYPAERMLLSNSKDVPVSPQRYQVTWEFSRDYLQRVLPYYKFKEVSEFFDILKIYEKPELFNYVVSSFSYKIEQLKLDSSELCIVSPEVRGIPPAAIIANKLNIPLVIIRKKGKIPGDVFSQSYSTAYSTDVLELSVNSDVKNKDVILIDDGIASGGTTVTCCDLIKQSGGKVRLVLGIINHTYKEKVAELKKYPICTLFDFAKSVSELDMKSIDFKDDVIPQGQSFVTSASKK